MWSLGFFIGCLGVSESRYVPKVLAYSRLRMPVQFGSSPILSVDLTSVSVKENLT